MCKYCKKLKELKDFDENLYVAIIRKWKRREEKARHLLERTQEMILNCSITHYDDPMIDLDTPLYDDIEEFLKGGV